MADNRKRLQLEIEALVQGAQRVRALAGDVDRLERQGKRGIQDPTPRLRQGLSGTERLARAAAGALTLVGASLVAREYVQATNQFQRLQGQLNVVSESQGEANQKLKDLRGIANETFSALDGTVQLYARLARSNENLNATYAEQIQFVRTTNQAIQASGASAQEASAGLLQLSQGLASGELRGEELRSVMEQMPRLAKAIATGLGVDGVGALRDMAEQGELTSDKVFGAILSQTEEIQREFNQLPKRVDHALTQLGNDLTAAFGQGDVDALVDAIDNLRAIMTDPEFIAGVNAVATGIARFVGGLSVLASGAGPFPLNDEIEEAQQRVENLQAQLELGGRRTRSGTIIARSAEEAAELRDQLERATARLAELKREQLDTLFGTGSGGEDGGDGGEGEPFSQSGAPGFRGVDDRVPPDDQVKRAVAIFRQTRTEMENYQSTVRELDRLLNAGLITQDTYNRAVAQAGAVFEDVEDKAKESTGEMSEFAKSAAQNMQTSFADFLFDPLEEGFDGLVESFARAIRRMMAEALSARILQEGPIGDFFTNLLTGNGGGGSGSTLHPAERHAGGLAGGGGVSRAVPASVFAGAQRLHAGGMPILRQGEVPAILRSDEEVLTRSDPRHRANGGLSGSVRMEFHNEGTAKESAREAEMQMSPEGLVVQVFLRDVKRGGPMSESILGLTGQQRGGG